MGFWIAMWMAAIAGLLIVTMAVIAAYLRGYCDGRAESASAQKQMWNELRDF